MAEYKQYASQIQETGGIMISEEVLSTIVEQAITDVEGVAGLTVKVGADIVELVGKKNWSKGLKVMIHEDDSVSVGCNILVAYGQSVVNVAKAAQEAVITALESMTSVKVNAVNVNVCGIARK